MKLSFVFSVSLCLCGCLSSLLPLDDRLRLDDGVLVGDRLGGDLAGERHRAFKVYTRSNAAGGRGVSLFRLEAHRSALHDLSGEDLVQQRAAGEGNLGLAGEACNRLSREDASDIFQSVCVELFSELPRLRKPRALAKWLIQITSHKCLHWKHREQRYIAADETGVPDLALAARAEEVLHEAEREQALRDSLLALQPRCARMIQMLFFDTPALPYSEIARQLGLATGSVGFIRGRCLDHLKKQLLSRGWK